MTPLPRKIAALSTKHYLDRDTRRGPRTRVLAVITRRSAHCSLLRTHKPGSPLLPCLARTPMPLAPNLNPLFDCSNPGLSEFTNPYPISPDPAFLGPGEFISDRSRNARGMLGTVSSPIAQRAAAKRAAEAPGADAPGARHQKGAQSRFLTVAKDTLRCRPFAPRHGARQSKLNVYCVCVCVRASARVCVCVRVGRPGAHTKKVEKAFFFVVWLIFVICAVSLDTTTSLPCCIHRLAVVRSVHGNVDLLTFAKELPCYVRHITLPA